VRADSGAEDSTATSGEWGAADEAAVEVAGLQARLARLKALDEALGAVGKKSQVRTLHRLLVERGQEWGCPSNDG